MFDRKTIKLAVSALLILILAAGAVFAGGTSEKSGSATSGTSTSSGSAAQSSEPITLKWWDWGDSYADYTRSMFQKYEKEHPNITVDYQLFTISQFQSNLLLAIRSGDAPDVFPIPGGFSYAQAVSEGWVQPLDPYIEKQWPGGVSAFKARFPDSSFVNGINVIDGKTYYFPFKNPAGNTALLYYNKTLFKKAGLDPEKPPKTWSELRDYAKKINDAGKGDFSGIIMGGKQINRWGAVLGTLGSTAGPVVFTGDTFNGMNYQTGRYEFENSGFVGAVNLFKQMNSDGSFYPGFLSLNAPQARALFGLGKAGFMFQGQWCVAVWRKENPDLDFGVMFAPLPDSGRKGYIQHGLVASGENFSLSATTKHPDQAAALLLNRSSDEWLAGYAKTGDGYAVFPSLNTPENITEPLMLKIFNLSQSETRLPPEPIIRNPDGVSQMLVEMKEVHPNFNEILQGAFTGGIDYVTAAKQLSNEMNAQLDQAVATLKAKGVNISRDVVKFPNWDPMKDYTDKDYQALK